MKIAINGTGRIGRAVLKIAIEKKVNVVAVNHLSDTKSLAYLLKYDSVYGPYDKSVSYTKNTITIDGKKIKVLTEPDPEKLPWKELGVDVVIEATGVFKDKEKAMKHINAGAKKVLISAPSKDPDSMIVLGVNENKIKKSDKIISMASCTTNCLAPVAKVLNDKFGIEKGYMTTIHAYTATQSILDEPQKKLRRGRAAAVNFVPTSSGATTALGEVIPSLKGKMDGLAIRAPVPCGSIVDFVVILKKSATVEQINSEMKKAANGKMKGVLEYSEDELVSTDIIKNPHSSIFDSLLTQSNGKIVKVLSWYDNEWGYSNRLVDMLKYLR
jgi:glyceraldehyde 3-phosphate dehydrogenase